MGPGFVKQCYSASKTRVNALMATHRIRDTKLAAHRAPRHIGVTI